MFCIVSILTSCVFANVETTREVVSERASHEASVIEEYNQVAPSWAEYQAEDWDGEVVLKAIEYSAVKHEGQFRKDAAKTPYIIHPIGVAEILWNEAGVRDQDVIISALLHDTLEDTNATKEEIAALFGERVAAIVKELTNDPNLTGEENKLRQVEHALYMSKEAQMVKLADRIYNLRDLSTSPPPSWSEEKIQAYYAWGEKLGRALKDVHPKLEQLLADEIARS